MSAATISALHFNLGWVPSVDVMPETMDGVRALAAAAAIMQDTRLLDRLELRAVKLLKIEPVERQHNEQWELIGLDHAPEGIVLHWRLYIGEDCPACEGSGELHVQGHNGRSYAITCPECDGDANTLDEERELETDIDGHPIREAA